MPMTISSPGVAINGRIASTSTQVSGFMTLTEPLDLSVALTLTHGTAAGMANQTYHAQRTLAGSANEELDLAGVLTDVFGNTITFTKVKALFIQNTHATNVLIVGGAASNGFATLFADATDKINIRPGGFLLLGATDATAYAVTAGTGDKLKLENSAAGSLVYNIVIIGVV